MIRLLMGVSLFVAIDLAAASDVEIKGGGLPPGCVCHSKVPEFVTMHNQFSIEDCRTCHAENEKLMGKSGGGMTDERKAALEERRRKESICQVCHRGDEVVVSGKSGISGHLFCAEGQKMYAKDEAAESEGKYVCPEHGTVLIDIDEIAVKSARDPKNEYCIACHPIHESLRELHLKAEAAVEEGFFGECLVCHESHSKCGGCHF